MTVTVNIEPSYKAAYDIIALTTAFQNALRSKHTVNHKRVMADCMADELPALLDMEPEETALAWLTEQGEKGASKILTAVPISDVTPEGEVADKLYMQIKEERVLAL